MKKKFEHISAIKGIAILMIIAVHSAQYFPHLYRPILYGSIYGQMGTQIFFITAGFLLGLHVDNNKESWILYLKRKYFKFVEPFLVAVILYFCLTFVCEIFGISNVYSPRYTFFNIITNILLLQQINFKGYNSIVPGAWFLGCLWFFYLIYPILHKFISHIYSKFLVNVLPFVASIISLGVQYFLHQFFNIDVGNNTYFYFSIINQVPAFIMGICYYYGFIIETKKIDIKESVFGFGVFTGLSLLLMYINCIYSFSIVISTVSYSFYFLLFIINYLIEHEMFKALFRHLSYIGDNTLGMYFVHFAFVWYVPAVYFHYFNYGNSTVLYILFLAISWAIIPWLGEKYSNLVKSIFALIRGAVK